MFVLFHVINGVLIEVFFNVTFTGLYFFIIE